MNDITSELASLDATPPSDLEARTLVEAGAADRAARTDSPIGPVWVAWSTRGITGLSPTFEAESFGAFVELHRRGVYESGSLPADLTDAVVSGLFEGETVGLPIDWRGLSPYQRGVLEVCATIPPGTIRPYGWIAEQIHNPGSVRAVGTALGHNPIPLLVPCHRVVRSDGSVGQYAFGADIKRDLLVREGALLA